MGVTAIVQDETFKERIRRARSKFIPMAVTYALGTFNDNFFRQAILLLAVSAGMLKFQEYTIVLFALPYLIFAAPAGWLADRFSKRRVIIGAKGLELLAMLCGAAGICTGNWALMLIMVFLMALQSAIFSPALAGSIPELYPASYVTPANARLRVATISAVLLGIGLAGLAVGRNRTGEPVRGIPLGQATVAVGVVAVSLLGLLTSLGVPRYKAAAPRARFPWTGPADTLAVLWNVRKDRLLAVTIAANTFIWSIGSAELLIINVMGLKQFALTTSMTGALSLAQLTGIAAGGLLSSKLARGEHWHRILIPSLLGMALVMAGVSLVPLLPDAWVLGALFALFVAVGVMGGLLLIPTEAFIQVRPAAERKGTVIAAGNFAVFTGILLSGPGHAALLRYLTPTGCFAALGGLALAVAVALAIALPRRPRPFQERSQPAQGG